MSVCFLAASSSEEAKDRQGSLDWRVVAWGPKSEDDKSKMDPVLFGSHLCCAVDIRRVHGRVIGSLAVEEDCKRIGYGEVKRREAILYQRIRYFIVSQRYYLVIS